MVLAISVLSFLWLACGVALVWNKKVGKAVRQRIKTEWKSAEKKITSYVKGD